MKPLDPRLVRRSATVRRHLAFAVGLGILQAVTIIATAWCVARVIGDRFEGAPLTGGAALIVGLVATFGIRAAIARILAVVSESASARVKAELRNDVAADLIDPRRMGPRPESARLVTLLGPGMDAFDGYIGRFLPQMVVAVVVPPIVIAAVFVADWISAVIVVVTLPLIVVFMALVGVLTRDLVQRRWAAMERLGRHFADVLDGIVLLKVFGRDQSRGLVEVGERHRKASMAALRIAFLSTFVLELVAMISVALVAVGVGLRVVEGHLGLVPAMFVLLLAPEAYLPVRRVGSLFHDSQEGVEALGAILDVLDHPRHEGTLAVPDDVSIEVSSLRVHHAGRDGASLEVDHETIGAGEFVTVIGRSGGGKSTLMNVLLGFIAPDEGHVTIGGRDLREIDIEMWRRTIAWVPQLPGFVAGTIGANVRLGLGQVDPDDVVRALADAGAGDLDPRRTIAESGADLSAGEKRRLAIARALVRVRIGGARVVLLDEPTAGLDADREEHVLATLRELDATVVVVSHRPMSVVAADRVIHLGGDVVGVSA